MGNDIAAYPNRVNNGYGNRSTGTFVVSEIADDFGAPRKLAKVGQLRK
jgi:hypothetical protein